MAWPNPCEAPVITQTFVASFVPLFCVFRESFSSSETIDICVVLMKCLFDCCIVLRNAWPAPRRWEMTQSFAWTFIMHESSGIQLFFFVSKVSRKGIFFFLDSVFSEFASFFFLRLRIFLFGLVNTVMRLWPYFCEAKKYIPSTTIIHHLIRMIIVVIK